MAGYYDPNKDYSRELQRTDLTAAQRSQLETERQNKINDKYGGKEPTMYGSNKTYSQASRDNDQNTISNAISIGHGRGSSKSASNGNRVTNLPGNAQPAQATHTPLAPAQLPALNQFGGSSAGTSSGGAVTTPSTTWQPGILKKGNRPDTSKHPEYAGLSVKQGHYTVTYNDFGYAVKAVNDDGASANATMKTTHANDSIYHQEAYQAAQRGDWDAVGTAINKIAMAEGKDQYGYDMTNANRYYGELVNEFRYNANDYYNKRYDETFGAGSAAVWDATNGAVKTYQQLVDAVGADMAQQIIGTGNAASGQMSIPGYGGGATGGFGTTGGSYGVTGGGYDYTPNGDAYQYIQDMYAANSASQLAALKAAYEQNVMDYNAQDDLISAEAQRQRNQAAAQNDIQRMYMNEMGIMQGLNTGATGQMALAQNAALQGNLANIGTQEQQALSDSALARAKLKVQYSAAVDQAVAQNDYELANALYQEYVRQDELAQKAVAAAQEQANWQAQFDYKKQQDAWNNAAAQAELLAGFGDFSGYKALGYSDAQINMMQNAWNAQYGTPVVGTTGTPGTPSATPTPKKSSGYNNGSLSTAQVMQLQKDLNKYLPEGQKIAVDGKWGPATKAAAGGYTADEYARVYYKQNSWSGRSDR